MTTTPDQDPVAPTSSAGLVERFEALGPWYTAFEIDGLECGGGHSYRDDGRVAMFFSWFGEPETILELGSFEGAHSLALAAPPSVRSLIGLEGRVDNITRAELVVQLLGRGNVEIRQADLRLAEHGHFDAVFCAGLLYHLLDPWRLIREIASVTERLFLDTHYAEAGRDERGGHRGAYFTEGGTGDRLSGLGPSSFWLTLPDLITTLNGCGFAVRHFVDHDDWAGAGRRVQLGAVKA